ncbi:MAG: preprotein translocase subunit SecY [Flavobacteriia bacterium]|jgi:preprotein translocase subunit SecY|nr:preprotein translocase subunit SecY [Flavobacteriia bacterium]NBV66960.1 preprotein translocase subunit SecY [Flavobacteriia bacterium]NBV90870.1 preprotein translocase subunit SecY [Flavobacteriia bacterium]NBY41027.1 preprotein translocase subunit SecY [Flavobacteriia bacterium]
MKRLITNLQNIWKVVELRQRILLTLGLVLAYRIGSFVILPGINYGALENASAGSSDTQKGIENLLSLFSGGGFTNASVMALGIMPYISASIIMQLLGMAVPAVQKLQNEGESGRKIINNYTRILTIIICSLQAPSYLKMYVEQKGALPLDAGPLWWTQTIIILVAGSMFAVWLGERITEKGIGNGISLLIAVGILSRLPGAFIAEVGKTFEGGNLIKLVLEIIIFMLIILSVILIVQGVRRIPLNTAKSVVGARSVGEQQARNYLPLKVNASGVMPIIFAQAILTIPMTVFLSATDSKDQGGIVQRILSDPYGFYYNLILVVLIVVFTYFYTAIMINPRKIADELKRSGGFVPGIRPGDDTANYIDDLVSRITFPGSLFLAAIAVIPAIAKLSGVNDSFAMFFGGTSLLIMVGVVLDTLQQIETYLLNRHMDGLMDGTRVRGRRGPNELSGF